MTEQYNVLIANEILFFSENDEDAFFSWLSKLDCVASYRGEGADLLITLKGEKISDNSLREVIALFSRYNIDRSQLSRLENDENRIWFKDPKKYWYNSVFVGA